MAPSLEALGFALVASGASIFPLSAGAHRALLDLLFAVHPLPATSLAVALGTWLAIVIAFRAAWRATLFALVRRRSPHARSLTARDVATLAVGSVAGLLVALAVHARAAALADDPILVGVGLLVSAAARVSTQAAPAGSHKLPTLAGALVVGVVQGASLLPGLSHTALGLASLAWLGVAGEAALDACFLLLIPVGAALLFAARLQPHDVWAPSDLVIALVSFGTAWIAIMGLRVVVRRKLLPAFSLYLVPLGVATLAWGYARP
jgi:undecaprenyl-diphosphatase